MTAGWSVVRAKDLEISGKARWPPAENSAGSVPLACMDAMEPVTYICPRRQWPGDCYDASALVGIFFGGWMQAGVLGNTRPAACR